MTELNAEERVLTVSALWNYIDELDRITGDETGDYTPEDKQAACDNMPKVRALINKLAPPEPVPAKVPEVVCFWGEGKVLRDCKVTDAATIAGSLRDTANRILLQSRGECCHVLYSVKFGKPGEPERWELGLRAFKTDAEFFETTQQAYAGGAYHIGAVHGPSKP